MAGLLLSVVVSVGWLPTALGAPHESVESLIIDGARQRLLVVVDDRQPASRVLVIFSGGDGHLGLTDTPPLAGGGYVSTLRRDFVWPGTALVLVDSPARHPSMSVEYRESAEHEAWVQSLFAGLSGRFAGVKFYAVGYSNGAVTALVAGRLRAVAGVVLVGGIFRRYADLAAFGVDVPLLVIHHEKDRCVPPDFDEAFRRVLKPTIVRFSAQSYDEAPCGPVSAHQFYAQEGAVADVVHGWLDTGRAPLRTR